jgi:hypothetical protein
VVSKEISDRDLEIVSESMARRVIEICAIDAYLEVAMCRAESFQPSEVQHLRTRMDELMEELAIQETAILLNWGLEGIERVVGASMAITGDIGHP